MKTFRELTAWQKAMSLAEEVYRVTALLPKEEKFGMTSQLRRAAISIAANIAEGYGRRDSKDFGRFVRIALGSLYEVQTLLELSSRLSLAPKPTIANAMDLSREVERLLSAFARSLQQSPQS